MLTTIILKPLHHRDAEQIGIYCNRRPELNMLFRNEAGARWSQTHKCWYIPLSEEAYNKLKTAVAGKAKMEISELKKYMNEKNKKANVNALAVINTQPPAATGNKTYMAVKPFVSIRAINKHVLPKMDEMLKLKGYSASTLRTYVNEMAQLLQLIGEIPADELKPGHLKRYLVYCYEKLQLKENTLHSRINALKFYYEQVLGREKFFWEIPRPKKQLILPKVLNEVEIGRMFRAIENVKHKAIVFMAYSAGLRVSEVVNMKLSDVDSQRMTLFIERAKGKKDRIVNLSPLVLDILRVYVKKCKPRPSKYLFEGESPGMPYSIRSAQEIFAAARKKAGIQKNVSFHALRHSFATHLLEKGVDIRYIKDILGHFDIKTTERYTHVSKRMLVNITSPLDDLHAKGGL